MSDERITQKRDDFPKRKAILGSPLRQIFEFIQTCHPELISGSHPPDKTRC
jgi:hypothetical protein